MVNFPHWYVSWLGGKLCLCHNLPDRGYPKGFFLLQVEYSHRFVVISRGHVSRQWKLPQIWIPIEAGFCPSQVPRWTSVSRGVENTNHSPVFAGKPPQLVKISNFVPWIPFFADPMCFPLNPCLFASTFLPQNPSPFIVGENLQFSAGFSCQTSIEIAAKKGLAITFVATDEDQEAVRDGFLAIKISWEYRRNIWYFLPVNVFHRYLELVFHGLVWVGLNMAGENRENRETRENRVYPQFRWMKLIFPIQKAIFGGIPFSDTAI